jgi:hypothetical protein
MCCMNNATPISAAAAVKITRLRVRGLGISL